MATLTAEEIRKEIRTKSRTSTIAADLASMMHANMFNDELRQAYLNEELNLNEWLYMYHEEGLEMIHSEGMLYDLEYELILENSNDIIDDIIEKTEKCFIDEIELYEDEMD